MNQFVLTVCFSAGLGWGQTSSSPAMSSLANSSLAISSSDDTKPITGKERLQWVAMSTVGPASLAGGIISAGWGTLFNNPREYGSHLQGFGDRYGMRLTGVATSNAMEAGLGSLWGEDPRYQRFAGEPFGARVGHIVKMTFLARNREGNLMPAYGRMAAITGSNFLSNTWRADSEATANRATMRVGLGILGRMAGNAFEEFWPDVRQKFLHRKSVVASTN
jgi:hypothetical protein